MPLFTLPTSDHHACLWSKLALTEDSGAAEKMGLPPAECMMVAAHLDDLKYAKQNGFRTLYVERLHEERHTELVDENIPDVVVRLDEDGFVEAARKLGIEIS